MSSDSSEPTDVLRFVWDDTYELFAVVRQDADQDEVAELVRIDRVTGNRQTCRLNAWHPLHIAGLARASDRHVLVGVRNTVVCVDIEKMQETCRTPEVDSPDAADAVDGETLCRHGFAFDAERRMLSMLSCYYDEAALYRYRLDKPCRKFTLKSRRPVGSGRPRGSGDLLGAAGICLRPNSGDVVAVFSLDNILLGPGDRPPQAAAAEAGARLPESARLCWLAVLSDRADTWIEALSHVDDDFIEVRASALPDWEPGPVAVDEHRFAFSTPTGKILLTDVETGNTVRLGEWGQTVKSLAWDAAAAAIQADLADGSRASIRVTAEYLATGGKAGPHKTIVRPRKRKRHQPPQADLLEPAFPLSWSTALPVAVTPDGTYAVAGRCVIHVPDQQSMCVLPHHWENIRQAAITKDGGRVFTTDGTVRMFDGRTGEQIFELGAGRVFALNPDETQIAVAGHRHVSLWDLNTGRESLTLPQKDAGALAWSPDGKWLAIGGAGMELIPNPKGGLLGVGGEMVELWDLARQECFAKLVGHARRVIALSWPREGRTLVSGDSDGSIRVWNVDNWECTGVIQTPEGCLYEMAVTDDGSCIVSAAAKNNGEDIDIARIWDASTNKEITALQGQNQELSKLRGCIAVTDDSRLLLADCNALRLCDMSTGKTIAEFGERWGPSVVYADLSQNGRWLTTWCWDRLRTVRAADEAGSSPAVQFDQTVRLWDLSTRERIALMEATGFDVPQHEPIVSCDGSLIAVCSDAQSVAVWESSTQTRRAHLPMSTARLKTMTFSDHAHFLATGDYDNSICVWDASAGAQITSFTGHAGPATCLAFSRDGQRLLSGSYDKSVRLWDWKNARCLKIFRGHSEEITSVAMTADGRQIISSSQDKTIRIWNSSTGKCDQILDGPANWHCTQLLLTADDKRLVARHEYEIWLWDLAAGTPLLSIPALSRRVGVDADGHVLTTVYDCIVQRWSL